MTIPVREKVMAALFDALGSVAISGLNLYRNKTTPIDKFPALILLEGPQEILSSSTQYRRYRLTVTIEGYIASANDGDIGPTLNALYAATVAAVEADPSLGGLTEDVIEGDFDPWIDRQETEAAQAGFSLTVQVDYATTDPYTIAP